MTSRIENKSNCRIPWLHHQLAGKAPDLCTYSCNMRVFMAEAPHHSFRLRPNRTDALAKAVGSLYSGLAGCLIVT